MTREALADAGRLLDRAADEASGEVADTLRVHAEQLADMAGRDRGPDHGRLARHQQRLRDARISVDDEVADLIDDAIQLINEHRETLEGV